MSQAVLSFDQKTCLDQKTKFLLYFVAEILLKEKKKKVLNQIKSN